MEFVDATLTKLATPATRAAVFDQTALAQIVETAYDADSLGVTGPYQPVFDELRLGPSLAPTATVDGTWHSQDATMRTELALRVAGVPGDAVVRVDALWRGSIVARAIPLDSVITDARTTWADAGTIDGEIHPLPSDPADLESARRARFVAHLQAGMADPTALTDAVVDDVLASLGATSVGDLIEHVASTATAGAITLTFSAPSEREATPRELPVTVAALIRDAEGLSIAQLLADSHALRDRLDTLPVHPTPAGGLPVRMPIVVAWLVPGTLFDDSDWPGATPAMNADAARDARRAAAGEWLAAEGIGLVTLT